MPATWRLLPATAATRRLDFCGEGRRLYGTGLPRPPATAKPAVKLTGLQKFAKEHPEHAELYKTTNAYDAFRIKMRKHAPAGLDGKQLNDYMNQMWREASEDDKQAAQRVAEATRMQLKALIRKRPRKTDQLPDGWTRGLGRKLWVHEATGVSVSTKPKLVEALQARLATI